MNSFQDEMQKQNKGNAYNYSTEDGYQAKISSMDPPKFQPTAVEKEPPHISTNPLYGFIKGIGAGIGTANIGSKLQLLAKTPMAKASPFLNIITGAVDSFDDKSAMHARAAGGARGISGLSALAGMAKIIPAVTEVAGLIAGGEGALSAGGAFASGSTALASGGAVLGAGAAGFGIGTLIDNVVGEVTSDNQLSKNIDKSRGIKRKDGEASKYKLSDLLSEVMVTIDQSDDVDENGRLNYKKTTGYQIAEFFSDKKNAVKEKKSES